MAVGSIMCSPPKKRSKIFNEEAIVMGNELTDIEINFTLSTYVHIAIVCT